ncbi:extracellular solute-binding protein [Paenibacillus sp. MMS18-CY102]|uniref:extracellular solute-binding protein n=1 Tax=Paenibacillus sp. MMS18-CY102 TaxID=2682849 RepID=UPI001365921F|nr:extracellular solute-binding protein [Paenibacillus sp. MMS18-CY102]MWC30764.1 extracellular solute-binding protein [Paenibacillus sp. MMS18-CY102]
MPHNPDGPNLAEWQLGRIYSINADSAHPEAAWEFVKYMNSEKMQRELAAGSLVTRKDLNMDYDGRSVQPLLDIPPTLSRNAWDGIPLPFLLKFRALANTVTEKVLHDNIPLKDALAELQTEGQAVWLQFKFEEKSASSEAKQGANESCTTELNLGYWPPLSSYQSYACPFQHAH